MCYALFWFATISQMAFSSLGVAFGMLQLMGVEQAAEILK